MRVGDDKNEELITFLERKLENYEKNLEMKQHEYEALQQEYYELQEKFNATRNKFKRAALIFTDFLDDTLNSNPSLLAPEKDLHLDLDRIKDRPFEELEKEDRVSLALVLFKQL